MKGKTIIIVIVLLIVAACAGFWVGRHHGRSAEPESASTEPAEEEKPVATVTVARVRRGEISDTLTAYGSVIADAGEVRVLSVPFESRISRVLISPGQQVPANAEVILVEASPDAKVALQDARNTVDAANRGLQQTKQKFEQHLATNQELAQAQEALKSANLKLQSMLERGVDKPQQLKAPVAGVVSKIDVQEGQIVAAGAALVEIAAQNRLQVKLGVDPEDASHLKPDQVVKLQPMEAANSETIEGHIHVIGNRVDPSTRMLDVLVSLPPDAHLMLDSFVVGRTTRENASGLIVPRQALVAEEDGFVIFTVENGQAIKHDVHIMVEDKSDVVISAEDVKEGDTVALVGALELEDKMAVEAKEATSGPSTEKSDQGAKP